MANYYAKSRTNYFRVTDEEEYQRLYAGLTADEGVYDFTKTDENGVVWHCIGAGGSLDWRESLDDDCDGDFDFFIEQLQAILHQEDAFIYEEVGSEKYRYLTGFALVATKDDVKTFSIGSWSMKTAREMLGNPNYTSAPEY